MIIRHRGFRWRVKTGRIHPVLALIWIGVPAAWALTIAILLYRVFA